MSQPYGVQQQQYIYIIYFKKQQLVDSNLSLSTFCFTIDNTRIYVHVYVEDMYLQKTSKLTAEKIFLPTWHFQPKDFKWNQNFYEFIIVDTGSIGIKHYKDNTNSSIIIHSTV